jgi:excinuclease UvrABC nuclease subunit
LTSTRASPTAELAALRATVREAEARPGVYRMLAEDGAVIYVGESRRLRARLQSYFRCQRRDKGARILRHTRRIEWEYTPSEFAALLLELRLIKRLRPRFNVAHKRDLSHYAFLHLGGGRVPGLSVHRAAQGRTEGDGLFYGPFRGPERLVEAARELADAFGLRDCADTVPLRFRDDPAGPPLTPGCLRHEIKKCLGPCVAASSANEYEERVALCRAFLEGGDEVPLERLRREMAQHAAALAYERAALCRDRIRVLSILREQLAAMRFALESLSFVYTLPGFDGDDRVYLVRRGTVRAEHPAPRSTPERFALQRAIDEVFQAGEPDDSPLAPHEIDEILLLSSWFRRFPEELARTWAPG